jgi:hypothetical protein
MKRRKGNSKSIYPLNPKTQKKWKYGEIREDGYVFQSYRSTVANNNVYHAIFKSPEVLKKSAERVKPNKDTKRRINTKTGKVFVQGEVENGKYFVGYTSKRNKDNFYYEKWCDKEQFLRQLLAQRLHKFKARALEKKLPYDLDLDFLVNIFPKDNKCPVLGLELKMGGNKGIMNPESPSLDRIIPEKGYTKDNVIWVSVKANAMKSVGTVDDLEKVAKFYRRLENEKR